LLEITSGKMHDEALWDKKKKFKKGKWKDHKIDPKNQLTSGMYTITRMQHPPDYIVDCFGGRIYTAITSCPSMLRGFLRYKGRPLNFIDIKTSQLTLLNVLFDEEFYNLNSTKYESFRNYFQIISKHAKKHKNSDNEYLGEDREEEDEEEGKTSEVPYDRSFSNIIQKVVENGGISNLCQDEVRRYRYLLDNDIYTWLAGFMNKECEGSSLTFNRDDAKTEMMRIIFTSNKYFEQPAALSKRAFAKEFPTIYNLMRLIKMDDRKNLCAILQRIESFIMLQNVLPRIYHEHPDVYYSTIHDSVATLDEHIHIVQEIMIEEITNYTSFRPKLETKSY